MTCLPVVLVYNSSVSAVLFSLLSRMLFFPVDSGVRPLGSMSRVESAQGVSSMNGRFYYTEVNTQMNFQQNSLQLLHTTCSSHALPLPSNFPDATK